MNSTNQDLLLLINTPRTILCSTPYCSVKCVYEDHLDKLSSKLATLPQEAVFVCFSLDFLQLREASGYPYCVKSIRAATSISAIFLMRYYYVWNK